MEPVGDWIEIAPWKSRQVVLIATDPPTYANTITDKRLLAATPGPLLVAWAGRWSTSVRQVTDDERETLGSVLE